MRQDGKVESKQLGNFEEAMEDLDMDEDMYDDIWQRGKGIELDIKDVKAIKNGDPDGSDENDLPVDLKEAMGVKPHKKPRLDKPKPKRDGENTNPEEHGAVDKFSQKLDIMTVVGEDEPASKVVKKCSTMHSLLTRQVQQLKKLKLSMGRGWSKKWEESAESLFQLLDNNIQNMDTHVTNPPPEPECHEAELGLECSGC